MTFRLRNGGDNSVERLLYSLHGGRFKSLHMEIARSAYFQHNLSLSRFRRSTRPLEILLHARLEVAAETRIPNLRLQAEFKGFYRWMLANIMAGVPSNEAFDRLRRELELPTS